MKKKGHGLLLISLWLNLTIICSQNQTNKWYFGNKAGLDFMTNPPTALTNGSMIAAEGCATISDVNGNLLFYSNGVNVWDKNHAPMANGTGLYGNPSSTQGVIIEKQRGNSNIYYVFTVHGPNSNPYWGVNYSVVDMNLAAGLGSVTVLNATLSSNTTERLTSTRHCNGIDTWIITHDYNSADFKAFLLTASGVNTVPVVSTVGPVHSQLAFVGSLKASPNGKKLALATYSVGFDLYDFDNSTGTVSNPLTLNQTPGIKSYGVEFSPDGTKLYGSTEVGKTIYQWDLCAGSALAIVASEYSVYTGTSIVSSMQRASNGKIYVARWNQQELGIINNPNLAGSACGYVDVGISIAPKISLGGLPNFNLHHGLPAQPFTYTTLSCGQVAFNTGVSLPTATCVYAATYSLTNQLWNFGDPASGSLNTSTLSSPTHTYSGAGSYTTQLILYYSCGGGTDTIKKVIAIHPCTGINEQAKTVDETVKVYPNPNSRYVYVECKSGVQVLLMNHQGQVILKQAFEAGINKIEMESLSCGIYFLQTVSTLGVTITRLMKSSD